MGINYTILVTHRGENNYVYEVFLLITPMFIRSDIVWGTHFKSSTSNFL